MLELDLSSFPMLASPRLLLRQFTLADAAVMHALRSDPRTMEHIGRPRTTDIADAEAFIMRNEADRMRNESISWAITLKDDPALIGTIGFYRLKPEHHRGEVGYLLAPDHWGRGLMSEALNAAVACGFERFRFHSIEAVTDPRNTRSRRLLERNGFLLEGLFKENFLWDGAFLDSAVYSKLATLK
jgi:[ribosomal protein S5]-alanine N-acetyltransferase